MTSRMRSILLASTCLGIWTTNLLDALAFHRWATEYLAHTASLDASNDLTWANRILSTAGVAGLATGLVVARVLARRPVLLQDWMLAGLLAMGIYFLVRDPAHPIHLLPPIEVMPVLPAAAFCALLAALSPWTKTRQTSALPTSHETA